MEKFYNELDRLKKERDMCNKKSWEAFWEWEDRLDNAELAASHKEVRRCERLARMAKRSEKHYQERESYLRAYIDGFLRAKEVLESC